MSCGWQFDISFLIVLFILNLNLLLFSFIFFFFLFFFSRQCGVPKGMSLMENADDPFMELREKFLPTFVRSCVFWLPVQTANFIMIPPRFRVIYMGVCGFMWVNILCWIKRQQVTVLAAAPATTAETTTSEPAIVARTSATRTGTVVDDHSE